MRTTLDIDPEILQLAKDIGAKERRTAGAVISELARAGFRAKSSFRTGGRQKKRNGIELLPRRGEVVTMEKVQRLMDEEGV